MDVALAWLVHPQSSGLWSILHFFKTFFEFPFSPLPQPDKNNTKQEHKARHQAKTHHIQPIQPPSLPFPFPFHLITDLPLHPAMPSRKREAANKLHGIREKERHYHEGVQGAKSYFTPSLVEICAKAVADTFPQQPRIESVLKSKTETENKKEADSISTTGEQLLQLVTCQLSTDLPLDVCVSRVTAEAYWKARSEARWPNAEGQLPAFMQYQAKSQNPEGDETRNQGVIKAEPDWKRTYLERHIEEFLMCIDDEEDAEEAFGIPAETRLAELAEKSKLTPERVNGASSVEILESLCKLAPDKIQKLHLDRQRAHLDWVLIFSWLPNLADFRVTFSVLDAGMHFRFNMFGIRKSDIVGRHHDRDTPPRGLVHALRDPRCRLHTLSLPENQIGDDETKGLLLGLIMNQTVEHLDLSHNKVSFL